MKENISVIKLSFISIIFLFISFITKGQNSLAKEKCKVIGLFLNSEKLTSYFEEIVSTNKDSEILFLDVNNIMGECKLTHWQELKISIKCTGPIIDSIKKMRPNLVIGKRKNIFLLSSSTYKGFLSSLYFLHPATNLDCIGKVSYKKKRYYLNNISTGVQ